MSEDAVFSIIKNVEIHHRYTFLKIKCFRKILVLNGMYF